MTIHGITRALARSEAFREGLSAASVDTDFSLVEGLVAPAIAALLERRSTAGEPPARRGYPPSVFAALPGLLERSGTSPLGSITAVYTVLVEGGDMEEPVADEVRGILDGHVILDRALGARGRWPAIDVLQSLSRVMDAVTPEEHRAAAQKVREHLAIYEAKRDLVSLGAYERGSDPKLDAALARIDRLEAFLRQGKHEASDLGETLAALKALV